MTGSKAPQLKRLAQWLVENPMFDVDPKWAELVKERGNLPHDLQKRLPASERKKGPGRPPLLSSPPGHQPPVSQSSMATSMASTLPFPSLATAGLGGLSAAGLNPSSILSGLSLSGFDPKNNPLLLPFSGMPNMSALGSMSGLGNLNNMNLTNSLFANLANLGLPSLAGMEGSDIGVTGTSSSSKTKNRKPADSERSHSSSKPPPVSSSSSGMSSSIPFFFPNPSLLYTPLGLGGLNPFSMQPGSMSSAYDSLAQQCGLLNGSLGVSGASTSTSQTTSSRSGSHKAQNSSRAATVTSSSPSSTSHRHRMSSRDALDRAQQQQLQQLLLPHDTHLLESLSRVQSADIPLRNDKRPRDADRKDATDTAREKRIRESERKELVENLSKNAQPDFVYRAEDRPPKKLKTELERKDSAENFSHSFLSNFLPQSEDWLKRSHEAEMKEALESLYKTSVEAANRVEERTPKRLQDPVNDRGVSNSLSNTADLQQSEQKLSKSLKEQNIKEDESFHEPLSEKPQDSPQRGETCNEKAMEGPIVDPQVIDAVPDSLSVPTVSPVLTVADTELERKSDVSGKSQIDQSDRPTEQKVPVSDSSHVEPTVSMSPTEEQPVAMITDTDSAVSHDLTVSTLASSSDSVVPSASDYQNTSSDNTKPLKAISTVSGSRRSRSSKKVKEVGDSVPVERKVLRSSAGRAAAAAAARAAAAAAAAAAQVVSEQGEGETVHLAESAVGDISNLEVNGGSEGPCHSEET